MSYDKMLALSADLAAAGISHQIAVGIYDDLQPRLQCRVEVAMPRSCRGGIAEAVQRIEELGRNHGLELESALMGNGLTFSEPGERRCLRVGAA